MPRPHPWRFWLRFLNPGEQGVFYFLKCNVASQAWHIVVTSNFFVKWVSELSPFRATVLGPGYILESPGELIRQSLSLGPAPRDSDAVGLGWGCLAGILVFKNSPGEFTCAAQAENHWSKARTWYLQILKSSTGNSDRKPGLRTATYTSCCVSLGFINGKALLSKNNSVNKYGRAYPCTAVYPFGVHSRRNNGAGCHLISNL